MWRNYSRSIFRNKWNKFKLEQLIFFFHFSGNNGFTPFIVYWTKTEKLKIIYYLGHQRFASPCRQQKKTQAGLHDDDDSVPKINAIQNCVNFSHRAQNETKVAHWAKYIHLWDFKYFWAWFLYILLNLRRGTYLVFTVIVIVTVIVLLQRLSCSFG